MKDLSNLLEEHSIFVRYGISGVIGILTNLIVLFFLTDTFGLWYVFSAILAYFVSFIVAFTLQKYWTFRDMNHNNIPRQATLYLLIAVGAFVLDIAALYILVDIFDFWYLGSQIFALSVIAVLSFLLNKNITFK